LQRGRRDHIADVTQRGGQDGTQIADESRQSRQHEQPKIQEPPFLGDFVTDQRKKSGDAEKQCDVFFTSAHVTAQGMQANAAGQLAVIITMATVNNKGQTMLGALMKRCLLLTVRSTMAMLRLMMTTICHNGGLPFRKNIITGHCSPNIKMG